MPNFQPSSVINFTGNIAGSPAATVSGNAYNAFNGTVKYRDPAAPSGSLAAAFSTSGIDTGTATADGNVVVTASYNWSPGSIPADRFIIFVKEGTSPVAATDPAFITNAASGANTIKFTVKPSQQYTFGFAAARTSESGELATAITNSNTVTTVAGNYTGNVYGTTAETLAQQPVFESYGPATFDFRNSTNGFTTTNANITTQSDSIIVSPTATDPQIRKTGLSFSGSTYQKVRARVRRVSGSAAWEGTVYYTTSSGPSVHGESGTYLKQIAAPSSPAAWNIVEWDMATSTSPLDWLGSTISGLRFDFSQSPDSNWEVDWISVGRTGIPTYGADYGSSPSNLTGLSGDGQNRIPQRYSGGFSVQEADADSGDRSKYSIFLGSPSKGSGVASFGIGSFTNQTLYGDLGPATGYYGSYAIKIKFNGNTTGDEVYFASSPAGYNIPLTPNSKWIISGKGWISSPSIIPFTAQLGLLTAVSPTTGYRANSTISTRKTWTDLSGTLNLTNDSSTLGTLVAGANITGGAGGSPYLWLDGLMLERKVGPGSTPTPWSKGSQYGVLGSSKGSTLIPSSSIGVGPFLNGMTMNQGDGNTRPVISGFYVGTARDADNIIFPTPYATLPTVVFFPGAQTTGSPFANTTNVSSVCEAQNLTTTGFSARIRFIGVASSTSPIVDTVNFGSGSPSVLSPGSPDSAGYVGAPSPSYAINKTNGAEAFDDKYKYTFRVTVYNTYVGPGEPYEPGNMDVGLYARKAAGWYLVSTQNIRGASGFSASTSKTVSPTVTIDGVIFSPASGQAEFAIVNLSGTLAGLVDSFQSVSYSVANPPTDISATASGTSTSYPVPFAVIATTGSS